jgi:2,5-dihydroxypyridine 5,6-dioxygenase
MTTEWRFIKAFAAHFARCALHEGETVAVLSESQSRPSVVETARLAAQSLGGRVFDVVVPTPPSAHAVPIRSTGASQALAGHPAVIAALAASDLVIDCTVEGLLHSPELGQVLAGGARVLMISNEHPEVLERIGWDPDMPRRVELGYQWLSSAALMRVTSAAGTDLSVQLKGAAAAGSTGLTSGPGSIAHWPGGLVAAFPAAHTVNGTVVLAPGDMNLTFNTLIQSSVVLHIADDHIERIEGDGVDAPVRRSTFLPYASYVGGHEPTRGTRRWDRARPGAPGSRRGNLCVLHWRPNCGRYRRPLHRMALHPRRRRGGGREGVLSPRRTSTDPLGP